ncbi:hypothetical protein HOY80DRAFT_1088321 [Tuber brumale]|nr:hypothetical protein HOY80DRAFT_1088321 [Tuber brumale]
MDIKFRSIIPQIALGERFQEDEVLRAGEGEYVQEWRGASFQDKLVRPGDQWLKRRVQEFKIRETELQIILLFEIMSLQRDQVTATNEDGSKERASKKKEKRSIGSVSEGPEGDKEHGYLKHFCVEVVLGFYASELPKGCKSINRKCGDQLAQLAAHSNKDASNPNKDKRKPKKKAPGFTRSITAPAATTATREAGGDTLAALVTADAASVSKANMHGGTLNPKGFVKRQVEIGSKVDAIDTWKRSNCIAVAADIVEDAKKRHTASSNRSITLLTLKVIPSANPL